MERVLGSDVYCQSYGKGERLASSVTTPNSSKGKGLRTKSPPLLERTLPERVGTPCPKSTGPRGEGPVSIVKEGTRRGRVVTDPVRKESRKGRVQFGTRVLS